MIKVVSLEKLGGRRLGICFSDGSFGEHDFSAMTDEAGQMLEPLRDPTYFARVFLDFGAPTWPNGFDIAPEWLQREMIAAGELRRDVDGEHDFDATAADLRRMTTGRRQTPSEVLLREARDDR
jgi:hypothetical protein